MTEKNWWTIIHWRCGFYHDVIQTTRRGSIKTFKRLYAVSDKEWKLDHKFGVHRCVKVKLVQV